MPVPLLPSPEPTDLTDWRIPRTLDRFDRAVKKVPKNGDWFVLRRGLGMTVAEQQARSLNGGATEWEWGYRVYAADGVLLSDLAVRWVGAR